MTQFLLNTMTGIVISVATAWFTVLFSLRRFYKEKWWERRILAYQTILYALYDMKKYTKECLWQIYESRERAQFPSQDEAPDEKWQLDEDLLRKGPVAELEIQRAAAIGDFLISKETAQYLEQLRSELRDAKGYPDDDERLEREAKALDTCLERIRARARVELKAP